jgi:hypothetical protein
MAPGPSTHSHISGKRLVFLAGKLIFEATGAAGAVEQLAEANRKDLTIFRGRTPWVL